MIVGNLHLTTSADSLFKTHFKWNKQLNRFYYKDKLGNKFGLDHSDFKLLANCLIKAVYSNLPTLSFFHKTTKQIAHIAHVMNHPISWNTSHLNISQYYPQYSSKPTSISLDNVKSYANIYIIENPRILDLKKTNESLIPNILQSLDATHTNLT